MPNFSLVHMAFCNDGNSSLSSNYHLLHGMLEWRWIYLTIIYKIDYFNGKIASDDCEVACEVKLLIYDLVTLSIAKFQKCNSANLIFTSPFICSCVKEMWQLIYSFTEKLQDDGVNFWSIISAVINEISNGKSLYEKFPLKKVLLRSANWMSCRNFDQFTLWMISGILKLVDLESKDDSSSNNNSRSFGMYESLIKNFLKTEQSEENMRVLLFLMSDILLNVWQPRSEILLLLWEHFQKKINSPFLIAGQSPNLMAVLGINAISYLEQIRAQQNTAVSKLNPNLTSYSMFIYILGKMVQRFTDDGQKTQVQRILGRIYTKFPPAKLKQLNEMGIHNILKLFVTLSISTNLSDIAIKVTDTLLNIPLDKPNFQQIVMRGHISILNLYCENRLNISQYLTKLLTQIGSLTTSSNILKVLSESLTLIVLKNLNESDEPFENGEDLFIDTWIVKYLQNSTMSEQDRMYESLTKIIQKIQSLQDSTLTLGSKQITLVTEKLYIILLPHAKLTFGRIESVWMPEMIATLCLLSLDVPAKSSAIPKFENLFKTFVEIHSNNLEQNIKFMTVVLRSCRDVKKLDSLLIMQNWIKFSVLLGGNNNELKELTKSMINLQEFSSIFSSDKTEEFLNSKEPLCVFINEIGRKYSESNNQQKFQLIEKMHTYFSTFDKWSLPILQQQTQQQQQQNTAQKSTTTNVSVDESVMRIYTFIAITFLHCSELIFIRQKTSCFFNIVMSNFILPPSLMMGQTQSRAIIVAMHKVWPLVIEGTARLNYKSDQHLNKVISDIIVKWAPLLRISNNSKFVAKPFIRLSNCNNFDLIEFFWAKLSKNFLALQPGRKSNVNCCLMLTMIEEVMHVVESDELRVMAIWKSIMQQVIEAAMQIDEMEPAHKICLSLIERFIKNKNFDSSTTMKELLMKNLRNLTDTSLSYHSVLYFR